MPSVRSSLWATGGGLVVSLVNHLSQYPAIYLQLRGDINGDLLRRLLRERRYRVTVGALRDADILRG